MNDMNKNYEELINIKSIDEFEFDLNKENLNSKKSNRSTILSVEPKLLNINIENNSNILQ